MRYVFENLISFDVQDRSLTHIQTNDNISLATTGVVLLEYLIENQGCIVTRNRLLADIFKKNDRTDSDSNLSHNISMLRKGFRDLGIKTDIIVTKPRVGLVLPENIKIKPIHDEYPQSLKNKHAYKKSLKALCLIPLFILTSIFSVLMEKNNLSHPGKTYSDDFVDVDGCKVYILHKKEDVRERISELITKESLPCGKQDSFYYLDNDLGNALIESLIHCQTSANSGEICGSYLSRSSL